MSDLNIDENTINKLKDMMNKGELSDVISQIPPEMIQNFSTMMGKNVNNSNENFNSSVNNNYTNSNSQSGASNNGFDFSKIDMKTIMKMTSVMNNLNNSNDPRSNLLQSLKPYMRESRKDKVDQYANLLNIAKVAELLKNDNNYTFNKENNKNA